jgi:c-di-GMP-binding flagellar brake protein YcgR
MTATARELSNAESIFSHLDTMAGLTRGAVLTVQGRDVFGELGYPKPGSGETTFHVDESLRGLVSAPRPGRTVRVEYCTRRERFAFVTEIAGHHTDALWRLAPPRAIERIEMRQHQRHSAGGLANLWIVAGASSVEVQVMDLSAGGLAFALAPGLDAPSEGAVLAAELEVVGLSRMPVELLVRHAREQGGQTVFGVSFRDMHPSDRASLTDLLEALGG